MKFSIYLNRRVFVMGLSGVTYFLPHVEQKGAVVLLQFFFVCASVVSYVAFVLSLFVPHLSFLCCLGRAAPRDCGISWVSSLIFFIKYIQVDI